MTRPMSPLSKNSLKRTRSWRTLPVIVIAFAMLFGLWQICLTFQSHHLHSRFPLDALRAALQEDSKFTSETSESKMLLETAIGKLVLEQDPPQESLILELQRLLQKVKEKSEDSGDSNGTAEGIADPHSRSLAERVSIEKQVETRLAEKFRAKDEQLLHELEVLKSANEKLKDQFVRHLEEAPIWKPLKDLSKFNMLGFLSDLPDRGLERGPPQLFEFPSALSHGRYLCFLGNDSSNGTRNFYTYAWEDALPQDHIFLNGTSLITENQYDYGNPWHSMYFLVQFVHWKQANQCADADRLLLYHWSEVRRNMGAWIKEVFTAAGLPSVPYEMEIGDRPICFQRAIASRSGIGGVPRKGLQEIYKEVRCLVRKYCKIPLKTYERSKKQRARLTLMVRSKTREWKNYTEWEEVIARECARVEGCEWTSMHVANLTFCEQAAIMSRTDILVSVHGAQLTNMIFMSPGSRVLEMFPKGWLELAGHGQWIYKYLAEWTGLYHEGYWRDLDHADCPFSTDDPKCMTHYKDLPVGINVTHVSSWLRDVITDFNEMQLAMKKPVNERTKPEVEVQWDSDVCTCKGQQR